jgi:hypothetical protein
VNSAAPGPIFIQIYGFGGNPLKYTDPDGNELEIAFYVKNIVRNELGGSKAEGSMSVYNSNTKNTFWIDNVISGGVGRTDEENGNTHVPFGTYDILETRIDGALYQRLEAQDGEYGDDVVSFKKANDHSLIRLHYRGNGLTWGCISVENDGATKIMAEMENTETGMVLVDTKFENKILRRLLPKEPQIKYGELRVVDLTGIK